MKHTILFLIATIFAVKGYSQTEEAIAIKILNETIKKDPENSELLYLRGVFFSESKQCDSAVIYFTAALKYLKAQKNKSVFRDEKLVDSLDIIYNRAYCYDLINSIENSVSDYRYLQSVKPADFMYSIAVARLYIKHKEFSKAQIEIDRLKYLIENERGLVYQSILFYEQGKYEDGLAAVNVALSKYPNSIEGLVTKVKMLGKLKRDEEACNTIKDAKLKVTLEYFGGERGYQRDFVEEIEQLRAKYCK